MPTWTLSAVEIAFVWSGLISLDNALAILVAVEVRLAVAAIGRGTTPAPARDAVIRAILAAAVRGPRA